MAYKNKYLYNPVTGQDFKFLQTSGDTQGKLLEMESTFNSRTIEPPPHYHPEQEEDFTILEGELQVKINGEKRILKKGDLLHIPAGTIHSMWSEYNGKTIVNWVIRPALNSEYFFETAVGLANSGKTNKKGMPGILQGSLMALHFHSVFRLAKPPMVIQKILFSILAPIARMFGYRPVYKEYIN